MKSELSYAVVGEKPLDFDFSEGYGEKWEVGFDLTEEEQDNQEYIPMMNYIYPLPERFVVPDDVREKLVTTTIVWLHDEQKPFLALTGGGMDLTWEICESYINLGLYPPAHFAGKVPAMAGRVESKKDFKILGHCIKSVQCVKRWAEQDLKTLRRFRNECKKHFEGVI